MVGVCGENNTDELFIPTLRALACVLTLARFHVHTSETLSLLKHHIWSFGQLAKVNFHPGTNYYFDIKSLYYQEIRESETYRHTKELSFSWPKMHSLTHLVESICKRGVISGCSTDRGEALHPQNRKDYSRSNRQATAQKQVSYFYYFLYFARKKFSTDVADVI